MPRSSSKKESGRETTNSIFYGFSASIKLTNLSSAGIVKVLPDLPNESPDTPKFFTNIDKEDFIFTWVGDMIEMNGVRTLDKTDYVVKPGETKSFPKYLVNFACTHLTNKILKREAFAKITDEKERKMGGVNWKNEEKAKELSSKMVAKNFMENETPVEYPNLSGQPTSTPSVQTPIITPEIKEEVKPEEVKNPLVCEVCGFTAKSGFGLRIHKTKHIK